MSVELKIREDDRTIEEIRQATECAIKTRDAALLTAGRQYIEPYISRVKQRMLNAAGNGESHSYIYNDVFIETVEVEHGIWPFKRKALEKRSTLPDDVDGLALLAAEFRQQGYKTKYVFDSETPYPGVFYSTALKISW